MDPASRRLVFREPDDSHWDLCLGSRTSPCPKGRRLRTRGTVSLLDLVRRYLVARAWLRVSSLHLERVHGGTVRTVLPTTASVLAHRTGRHRPYAGPFVQITARVVGRRRADSQRAVKPAHDGCPEARARTSLDRSSSWTTDFGPRRDGGS